MTTCNLEAVPERLLGCLAVGSFFLIFPHKYTLTFSEGGGRTPSLPVTVKKWLWLIPPSAYEFCMHAVTQVHRPPKKHICVTQLVWLHQ